MLEGREKEVLTYAARLRGRAMTNLAAMTDRLIEVTGLDATDLRLRARYMREAGLQPAAPKGGRPGRKPKPQIEAIHAVILMLGSLAGGPQLRAPEAVRTLWARPLSYQKITRRDPDDGTTEEGLYSPYQDRKHLTFGGALLILMEEATKAIGPAQKLKFQSSDFAGIAVTQGDLQGQIHYVHRLEFFTSSSEQHSFAPNRRAPVTIISSVDPVLFLELGEVVAEARREAIRLGITIPTRDAWRALGIEPPPDASPALGAIQSSPRTS
jgi:hypothetical protein